VAADEHLLAELSDPDGRAVVLPERIWEDKIIKDHPELRAHLDELKLGTHIDATLEAAGNRARSRMEAVDTLGLRPLLLRYWQRVVNGDPLNHEHAVTVPYLADRLDLVPLRIDFDLTRLQRAGESAGQSAARRGDDVVERRGVRRELLRIDSVVLGHLRMHAESHGLALRG
jgi:hypothetical protein